jgi:hypothetical protein
MHLRLQELMWGLCFDSCPSLLQVYSRDLLVDL